MFFWPVRYITRHDCTPIPIDKEGKIRSVREMQDCAAFGIYEQKHKVSQCPVCLKEYDYDHEPAVRIKEIAYNEYLAIKLFLEKRK